ncbi:carbohydrate-binding protein [Chitinophaga sp.]|uniref:carbohydrate-binding protein n=1 Tax=Chitinophaga sp. TaxID=1869181 RepID=UPI0031E34214
MNAKNCIVLLLIALLGPAALLAQSGIYAGGPVYKNRSYSISELKNSGFTYVVVWTIHIDASGNFNFNAEFPLVQNGAYIGASTYPDFANDIALLKSAPTTINRVEFCISAWGSATFTNIKNLIAAQGTGSTSILYRNFQALKNAIPAVDAIAFDDESTYDVSSSTALAVMLGNLGYKVTLVPYMNSGYWTSVATNTNNQLAGTVTRVDLQCYSGGASNNPCSSSWNFGAIPIYAGLWDAEKSTAQVTSTLNGWKNSCSSKLGGGFIWLYDDIDNSSSTAGYASAVNNVFGGGNKNTAAATFYKDCNYSGLGISLPTGNYTLAQLLSHGILNDDISSIQVSSGYQTTVYANDNYGGSSLLVNTNNSCLVNNSFNDIISSLKVSATTSAASTTIQAENYSSMSGVQTESTTDTDGGLNVGYIDTGDWLAYSNINIPVAGTYRIDYRVASESTGGQLSLDLNGGSTILGYQTVPVTGGWQNWQTVSQTVSIAAGTYALGIYAQSGGWNLNWWSITPVSTATARMAAPKEAAGFTIYPNPAQQTLKANIDLTGSLIQVYNISGQQIMGFKPNSNTINISRLTPGMYTLVVTKEGNRTTRQFIKY